MQMAVAMMNAKTAQSTLPLSSLWNVWIRSEVCPLSSLHLVCCITKHAHALLARESRSVLAHYPDSMYLNKWGLPLAKNTVIVLSLWQKKEKRKRRRVYHEHSLNEMSMTVLVNHPYISCLRSVWRRISDSTSTLSDIRQFVNTSPDAEACLLQLVPPSSASSLLPGNCATLTLSREQQHASSEELFAFCGVIVYGKRPGELPLSLLKTTQMWHLQPCRPLPRRH